MGGVYKKGFLFQSLLEINEHLECTLKTELGSPYQEQKALIDVSTVNYKRIQVTTTPQNNNHGLICSWLITKSPNDISIGAFYHCGSSALLPFAGYMALLEIEGDSFKPEDNIPIAVVGDRIRTNPNLKPLYDKLKTTLDGLEAAGIELPEV